MAPELRRIFVLFWLPCNVERTPMFMFTARRNTPMGSIAPEALI
jgi:hypothetical protein